MSIKRSRLEQPGQPDQPDEPERKHKQDRLRGACCESEGVARSTKKMHTESVRNRNIERVGVNRKELRPCTD